MTFPRFYLVLARSVNQSIYRFYCLRILRLLLVKMFPFTCGLLLCLIFSLCLAAQVDYCPPLGPVDEVPRKLAENKYLRQLSAQYASTFLKRISKNITAEGFDASTTSFSVNIFSAHECESIFQYHFTSSSLNSSSTKKVDENTVYRIGSITKVVTVLALLLQDDKVHFDDPITKHIPELARIAARQAAVATENFDDIATTQWSHITVGALASQLAGIGRSGQVFLVVNWCGGFKIIEIFANPLRQLLSATYLATMPR